MKELLKEVIAGDESYNKSASRYLYKTNPELWQWICSQTAFLPNDSLPKQRVWHILNDKWNRPVCPITGDFVQWHENKYRQASSRSYHGELVKRHWQQGTYDNINTEEIKEARRQGNLRCISEGRRHYRPHTTYTAEDRLKMKQTSLERYGVDNPAKLPIFRKKISQANDRRFEESRAALSSRELYRNSVWKESDRWWYDRYYYFTADGKLRGNDYHLDHIFSISEGFRQNIPAYIIGHWTNLRLLDAKSNHQKRDRCDKTVEQLFEDFFKVQG